MDFTEEFKQFEKGNYKPNINKWEIYLKNRFNIHYQFKANHLLPNPLKLMYDNHKRKESLLEKYSPNNYSIILPKSGIEINCTKNFVETVPLMENIFNGKWKEKAYQIQYYNEELKKILYMTIYLENYYKKMVTINTIIKTIFYKVPNNV